jgi:hypothetical protein
LIIAVRFVEESLGAEIWKCQFEPGSTDVVITPEGGSRRMGPGGGQPIILKGKIIN